MRRLQLNKDDKISLKLWEYEQQQGFRCESELGTLCQDLDQHIDTYPDGLHYNYYPVPVSPQEPKPEVTESPTLQEILSGSSF